MTALEEYCELFPDYCMVLSIGSGRLITRLEDDPNSQRYISPPDENEDSFRDRLERSKKAGKNLFLDEWEPFTPVPYDHSKINRPE